MFNFLKKIYNNRLLISRMIRMRFYYCLSSCIHGRKHHPEDAEKFQQEIVNKIKSGKGCNVALLMVGKGIGDAIVLSGFIDILKQHSCKVSVICYDRLMNVVPSFLSTVDEFILVDKHDCALKYMFNRKNFDVVVDFFDPDVNFDHHKLKFFLKLKCHNIIGFNQNNNALNFIPSPGMEDTERHYSNVVKNFYAKSYTYNETQPFSHRAVKILNEYFGLNIPSEKYRYRLDISDKTDSSVSSYIRELKNNSSKEGCTPQIIVFNATASDKYRSLSPDLVNRMCEYFINCTNEYRVIIMNFKQEDLKVTSPKIIFNPFKTFDEVIALIKYADFVISPDTSIVHVGCTFDKNAIYFYNNRLLNTGHENNVVWGPINKNYLQVFSDQFVRNVHGDDLRELKFSIVKDALIKMEII